MTLNVNKRFPLVIATGDAFCNRIKERIRVRDNVLETRHTLLMSPRRYGKTSLATQVITETHLPSCTIDLFTISNERSLYQKIYHAIGKLLLEVLPTQKRTIEKINQLFSSFNPKIELSVLGQKLILSPDSDVVDNMTDIFMSLDKLAVKEKKKIIILMEEFQQVTTLDNTEVIEGAIRHAIERSQNVSYIFSGSNRHLLAEMFEDSNRPLYQCCDRIQLERISPKDYQVFLDQAALDQWGKRLGDDEISEILKLTRCHPYYLNVLCSRIWREKNKPSTNMIRQVWIDYVQEEKIKVVSLVTSLSKNQRAILIVLAEKPISEPTGIEFLNKVVLSSSSVNQALKVLLHKDLIFINENNEFEVLDPVVAQCLNQE